jgi:hypothetical protein
MNGVCWRRLNSSKKSLRLSGSRDLISSDNLILPRYRKLAKIIMADNIKSAARLLEKNRNK